MLMLFGDYLLDRDLCVSPAAHRVLRRLGVSEHATRSTLTRMVNRDLLRRQRGGRRMYFGLTPQRSTLLRDGQAADLADRRGQRPLGRHLDAAVLLATRVLGSASATGCASQARVGRLSGRCRAGCGSRRATSASKAHRRRLGLAAHCAGVSGRAPTS
jgi:hypothetical protein